MAISVTPTYEDVHQNISGALRRRAVLTVTGLTAAAANTIPPGLPKTPNGVPNYPGHVRDAWIRGAAAGRHEPVLHHGRGANFAPSGRRILRYPGPGLCAVDFGRRWKSPRHPALRDRGYQGLS